MATSRTSSDRRLSAIMFTDIVGYSALTQKNESKALHLLSEHNSLLRSIFPKHNGTEIKTIGDAFLVEFSTALDAVQCAVGIQQALHERNLRVPPEDHVRVRIGVHLGDVVHEDGDVFGDGVNIASRIYPVARPGSICLSASVAQVVHNKIDAGVHKLPQKRLKNISLPVELFEIDLPWMSGPGHRLRFDERWGRILRPVVYAGIVVALGWWIYLTFVPHERYPVNRLAVLPFREISGSPGNEFFAEGMTEELISSLSKISGLEVIARSSVTSYQAAASDIRLIADKLKAGSIVEGSVRSVGDSVRVTIRLVETSSERLLWSDDFNRAATNALRIQDEVAMNVAGALRVQLLDAEKTDLLGGREYDPDAVRTYLLGRYSLNRRTPEDVIKSVGYFERAISLDSSFAHAYTGLAEAYVLIAGAGYGSIPRERSLSETMRATDKAIALDPRLAEAYAVRAYALYRLMWKWKDADSLFRRALQLKPSYARGHEWYGLYLSLKGRTHDGLMEMRKAASLDPGSPSVATGVGRLLAFDHQYGPSIDWLTGVIREHPDYAEAYFALALSQTYAGLLPSALINFEKAIELSGRRDVILADYAVALARSGRSDRARAILHELDSVSTMRHVDVWVRGIIHAGLGDIDTTYALLKKALDEREGLMVYMRSDPLLSTLLSADHFRKLEDRIWDDD